MQGGRFLGSGTYGCVFTPPLLCKTKQGKTTGKVGKITLEPFANQEVQVANRIRRVPLANNYFLLPEPELCELAKEEKQTDPGLQECRAILESQKDILDLYEMRQLTIPFGGIKQFYQLFDDGSLHPSKFDFFVFMRHMLEAGSSLLLAGVCHFDLHQGNLLMDKHKVIRILDFGLSFTGTSIDEIVVNGRWKRLRFGFEPDAAHPSIHNSECPELTLMNAIRRNEYTPDMAIKLILMGKEVFKDMEVYLGVSKVQSAKDLMTFWSTSDAARRKDFVKLWKTYWPGFDAWALGCILLDTLKYLVLLPEFTEGEYKSKQPVVLATLRGLLDPNPRTRLDCMEALALFDPGNPWLARFGRKWLAVRKQQRRGKIEGARS